MWCRTSSEMSGEYWATCFRVLDICGQHLGLDVATLGKHALLRYPVEGALVVETKVAGVDDIVGPRLLGEIIQRT